ncbi:hypothetical protein N7448_005993 [Penicillium atrosanguineum]|uniref:Carbon-nitrogen hydrolase n=1 Tax=Penicillium atrosanguineum TaxID=1132637 RepID=UPI002386A000|nr:Carbon-nitrogen hydrolase [Penicillium atrosanguineum]KAJ5131835.1 hypothetical protein N7448_005993 [Penicillium atrosanguineum]KAJ5289502.1 Carbon-nitrogen hydrolase [Penicillium atrosanguineum]
MSTVEDPVLAKPVDLCCLKGSIHSGEPAGKAVQIGGVNTYVATPHAMVSNDNVLLFFPDAFGLQISNFLTMDAFAACGEGEAYAPDLGPYLEAFSEPLE